MAPNSDFESQSFNYFSVNEVLHHHYHHHHNIINYLYQFSSLDSKYYVPGEVEDQLKSLYSNSVLHLNIRSMRKHFKAFQNFNESLNFKFSAICLSETWLQPHETSDSNFRFKFSYKDIIAFT